MSVENNIGLIFTWFFWAPKEKKVLEYYKNNTVAVFICKLTFHTLKMCCTHTDTLCIHVDNVHQNRLLLTHSQTQTHPPQSHSLGCFEHSWPLCFTYLCLSVLISGLFFLYYSWTHSVTLGSAYRIWFTASPKPEGGRLVLYLVYVRMLVLLYLCSVLWLTSHLPHNMFF